MTLYDYLKLKKDDEVTICDDIYDTESYWYYFTMEERKEDQWNNDCMRLAKKLQIKKINKWNVICNISDLIEQNIDKIIKADLFGSNDLDNIMYDFDSIIAGYVSEKWFNKFVNCLVEK